MDAYFVLSKRHHNKEDANPRWKAPNLQEVPCVDSTVRFRGEKLDPWGLRSAYRVTWVIYDYNMDGSVHRIHIHLHPT